MTWASEPGQRVSEPDLAVAVKNVNTSLSCGYEPLLVCADAET